MYIGPSTTQPKLALLANISAIALCLTLIATVLLKMSASSYAEDEFASEKSDRIVSKTLELNQVHCLLRRLNEGEAEEVKRMLTEKMCDDVVIIDSWLPGSDANTRELANRVFGQIASSARKHPETCDFGFASPKNDCEKLVAQILRQADSKAN